MWRAALLALLAGSLLAGPAQGQRTGAMSRGSSSGGSAHSGIGHGRFVPWRGAFSSRFEHRNFRDRSFFPYLYPYGDYWGYDPPYSEVAAQAPAAPAAAPRAEERAVEAPVPKAQVIEIPAVNPSGPAKTGPPAVFLLTNGERLESNRFLLTATHLSVSVDHHQRTIPLDMLDLDATIATNRERGIDLRIPADRNEISLSF